MWHFTEQWKHTNNSIHGGLGIDLHSHVNMEIKFLALREMILSNQSGGLIPQESLYSFAWVLAILDVNSY